MPDNTPENPPAADRTIVPTMCLVKHCSLIFQPYNRISKDTFSAAVAKQSTDSHVLNSQIAPIVNAREL